MTQSADNDIERLLTMVETQAQDAAEILARKRVSLEGLIYLSNSVLLPSALYRLKLSHATCEQIDRVQSPVRRVLAKKAGLTSASTDVLLAGSGRASHHPRLDGVRAAAAGPDCQVHVGAICMQ